MNRKTPLLIAVLASAAFSARAQNLVVNPGFETGNFTGWSLSGDTSHCQVTTFMVHSGTFSAQLGNSGVNGTGILDQTITTVAGQSYNVDFWLANHNGQGLHDDIVVSFAGVTILSLVDSASFTYTHFSRTVRATSTSSLLRFEFYHTHTIGFFPFAWYLD